MIGKSCGKIGAMTRTMIGIATALATLGACDAGPPPTQSPPQPTTTEAATAASPSTAASATAAAGGSGPSEPTPDPITHPCVVKAAQFKKALDEADDSCKTAADCDCYPGGVAHGSPCGGVTGKDTAKRLHAIAAEFHAMKCEQSAHCAAWRCEPKCTGGKCVR
jgi:hypothetical protein